MRISRLPFDPESQYVATRPQVLAGIVLKAGDAIPDTISERRRRQLFDVRRIHAVEPPAQTVAALDRTKTLREQYEDIAAGLRSHINKRRER